MAIRLVPVLHLERGGRQGEREAVREGGRQGEREGGQGGRQGEGGRGRDVIYTNLTTAKQESEHLWNGHFIVVQRCPHNIRYVLQKGTFHDIITLSFPTACCSKTHYQMR